MPSQSAMTECLACRRAVDQHCLLGAGIRWESGSVKRSGPFLPAGDLTLAPLRWGFWYWGFDSCRIVVFYSAPTPILLSTAWCKPSFLLTMSEEGTSSDITWTTPSPSPLKAYTTRNHGLRHILPRPQGQSKRIHPLQPLHYSLITSSRPSSPATTAATSPCPPSRNSPSSYPKPKKKAPPSHPVSPTKASTYSFPPFFPPHTLSLPHQIWQWPYSTSTFGTTTSTCLPSRNATPTPPRSSSSCTRSSRSSPSTSKS